MRTSSAHGAFGLSAGIWVSVGCVQHSLYRCSGSTCCAQCLSVLVGWGAAMRPSVTALAAGGFEGVCWQV